MSDFTATADRIELVLGAVVSEASGWPPSPQNYFVLFDQSKSDHWIIGFLFANAELLREALEQTSLREPA